MMEYTKGDKTLSMPGWVIAAGFVGLAIVVTELCKK